MVWRREEVDTCRDFCVRGQAERARDHPASACRAGEAFRVRETALSTSNCLPHSCLLHHRVCLKRKDCTAGWSRFLEIVARVT
jgi:hypothetical protein